MVNYRMKVLACVAVAASILAQDAVAAVTCPKGFVVRYRNGIPAPFQAPPNHIQVPFTVGQPPAGFSAGVRAEGGTIIASSNLSTDLDLVCVHQNGAGFGTLLYAPLPSTVAAPSSCKAVGSGFECSTSGGRITRPTCPTVTIAAEAPGFSTREVTVPAQAQILKSLLSAAFPLECLYVPGRVGARVVTRNTLGTGFVAQGGTFFSKAEAGGGGAGGGGGGAVTVEAESMSHSTGGSTQGGWNIWANGNISKSISLSAGRRYRVTLVAKATRAQNQGANFRLRYGNQTIASGTVNATSYSNFGFDFTPSQGQGNLIVEFTNDLQSGSEDRNLMVDKVTLTPQ